MPQEVIDAARDGRLMVDRLPGCVAWPIRHQIVKPDPGRSLGRWASHHKEHPIGGLVLDQGGYIGNTTIWQISPVGDGPVGVRAPRATPTIPRSKP